MGGLGGAEVILLDTHVLVWMVTDPKRLSRTADREIHKAQRDRSCAIASISLLELAQMFHNHDLRGVGSIENSIRDILEDTGVKVLEITPEIADLSMAFPETYPKDPSDRLIGATGRAYGLTLLTRDERIRSSPLIRALW
jgi:PIN domain nuclease of toxin-antitoxin system